jgi:hypothetical protein
VGHGLGAGHEHVDAEPVVEVRVVAARQRDGALHDPGESCRGEQRELDEVPAPFLCPVLLAHAGVLPRFAHHQRDPGPQRGAGDFRGVVGVKTRAT